MEKENFYRLVGNMRYAQKQYFKTRRDEPDKQKWLIRSKQIEILVDQEIDRYMKPIIKAEKEGKIDKI